MNESIDPIRDLDLNLLHTFRVFAVEGNVERSARILGRSQPAISTRMRQLERELGIVLFERIGRRLHLTPAGRDLDRELEQLFGGLTRIVELVRAGTAAGLRRYRIGALPTVGVYLLAPAVARIRERHPNARFDIRTGTLPERLRELAAGTLDAVAGVGRPPATGAHVVRVGEALPVVVARTGDPALRARVVTARALAGRPLVAFGRTGDDFFDVVADWIERHHLTRNVVVEVAHIQMLKALVAAGVGVAIVPSYTVVEPGLATRAVSGLRARRPIWFATRPPLADDPVLAGVADQARALLR